jgi:hypothetical protein
MQPAKVNILIGQFCYSSNGGYSAILPQIGDWWAKVYHEMMVDERINVVAKVNLSDTPVTMTRNSLLRKAVAGGFDVLLLIDSDNEPDLYVGHDSAAKPFWKSSFDFAYRRLTQGLPTCIAAPYCGPPPHPINGGEENCYVFKWKNWESDTQGYAGAEIIPVDRTEAALMTGISPQAALPTGLMLLTVNALEAIKPPYFRYEWKDAWEAEKASTEDVYFTRNLAMAGRMKWGAPIVFANWDAWAGHHKPKCVGKPVVLRLEQVCETFAEAVRNNFGAQEQMVFVNPEMSDAQRQQLQELSEAEQPPIQTGPVQLTGEVEMRFGHPFRHLGWRSSIEDRYALEMVVQQLPDDMDLQGVEVGSWVGDSAVTILTTRGRLFLTCVDTFDGSKTDQTGDIANALKVAAKNSDIVIDTFCDNLQPYKGRCAACRCDSSNLPFEQADGSLDFIYIDAGHSYEEVKADIEAWLTKLKHAPHAIIAGHDYNDRQFPGVKQAVDEAFGDKVQYQGHVWYVKPCARGIVVDEQLDGETVFDGESLDLTGKTVFSPCPASLADIDREHLVEFLDVWNKGGNPKRILYCGEPDFKVLGMLVSAARGGSVFCAVEGDMSASQKRFPVIAVAEAERKGVRFVFCEDLATADFWNGDNADLVFIHESASTKDVFSMALLFVKGDGAVLGNGTIDAPDGTGFAWSNDDATLHVEHWVEGTLWAVFAGQVDTSYEEGGENYDPPDKEDA